MHGEALSHAGELSSALAFSWAQWQVVPLCCAAALAGYLAVMCVLAIIQHHGATVAECVKSMRKVLQVCLPDPTAVLGVFGSCEPAAVG